LTAGLLARLGKAAGIDTAVQAVADLAPRAPNKAV
jgi:hypothetical protein